MGMLINRHRERHGDEAVKAEGDAPEAPSKSWKRADLDAYAATNGIDVSAASNKGEVLDLIEAHTPKAEGDAPEADGGTPTE